MMTKAIGIALAAAGVFLMVVRRTRYDLRHANRAKRSWAAKAQGVPGEASFGATPLKGGRDSCQTAG